MKLRKGKPEDVGMSPERLNHVRDLAAGWVDDSITPSLVVLAARKGVIVLHEAYGTHGPESNSPSLKKDAIFPIASITKPITATATMLLVEEGRLGLNRPVSEYLPEFIGAEKEKVMLHHLLTHTSGIREEELLKYIEEKRGTVQIPSPEKTQDPWINEYLHLSFDIPLWKPPGVEMSYADYNYDLLGEIIRRVSGQPLADFAHERIFHPLGMKKTSIGLRDLPEDRIVRRPLGADWGNELAEWITMSRGSVSALSTVKDLAIFGQMLLNEGIYADARLLSPSTVREMTRNQIPGIQARYLEEIIPEAGWGWGWSITGEKVSPLNGAPLLSPRCFAHGGSGGAFIWCDPTYDLVGVYLYVRLQSEDGEPLEIGDLLINPIMASIVEI